eukprot:SAG31_NODE_27735_length_421_cov_0.639752_1_plen_93_part_01
MLGLGGLPAVVQLVGFLFLPESPRFLAKKGHTDAARAVLQQIRGGAHADIELEFAQIVASVQEEDAVSTAAPSLRSAWATPSLRRAIVLGAAL